MMLRNCNAGDLCIIALAGKFSCYPLPGWSMVASVFFRWFAVPQSVPIERALEQQQGSSGGGREQPGREWQVAGGLVRHSFKNL